MITWSFRYLLHVRLTKDWRCLILQMIYIQCNQTVGFCQTKWKRKTVKQCELLLCWVLEELESLHCNQVTPGAIFKFLVHHSRYYPCMWTINCNNIILISNRSFLVHFGSTSGRFVWVVVCILVRCNQTKITKWAWYMYATKVYKKDMISYLRTQISQSNHDIIAILGQWPVIAGYHDNMHGFW